MWKLSDSCDQHAPIRMFEDDVTWREHGLVMEGGPLVGLGGCWSDVCDLKNVRLLWAV